MFKIIFILSNIITVMYSCTIGAAYNHEGRPYLFKVRDRNNYNENQLHYNTSGNYSYVGIVNVNTNLIDGRTLGGINDNGFAIVNAVLDSDEDIDTDHGEFMHSVLSNHQEIQSLQDSMDEYSDIYVLEANFMLISGQNLWTLEKNSSNEYTFIQIPFNEYKCRSNFLISDLGNLEGAINKIRDLFDFDNHGLIQFYHRNIAYLIIIYVIIIGLFIFKNNIRELIKPFYFVSILLIFQIFLGITTLISGLNIYLASAHQIGSLLLILSAINLYYNSIN